MSVAVHTTRGGTHEYPAANAVTENESGSLTVYAKAEEEGTGRAYALFARGEWLAADLRDDTPTDQQEIPAP